MDPQFWLSLIRDGLLAKDDEINLVRTCSVCTLEIRWVEQQQIKHPHALCHLKIKSVFLWKLPPGVQWNRKEFIWPRFRLLTWIQRRNQTRETEASAYSLFSRRCCRKSAWRHLANKWKCYRGAEERREKWVSPVDLQLPPDGTSKPLYHL